jgi:hypothetical protein
MAKKEKENCICEKDCGCKCHMWKHQAQGSAIYGLGFIGALVYYLSTAGGFWLGVLGVLKAIVWPALLIFNALKFLGM